MYESAKVECTWRRLYGNDIAGDKCQAPWLLTLSVRMAEHGIAAGGSLAAAYPQTRAVTDNFGNLVCVKGWGR